MALLEPDIWAGKIFTGSWNDAPRTAEATEPATDAVIGKVGMAGAEELALSASTAADAGRARTALPCIERARVIERATDLLQEHRDKVRDWLQREAGKVRTAAELELPLAIEELRESAAFVTEPWAHLLQNAMGGRAWPSECRWGWRRSSQRGTSPCWPCAPWRLRSHATTPSC